MDSDSPVLWWAYDAGDHNIDPHTWVAGMVYVHADDVASVAAGGGRIECDSCGVVYTGELTKCE